MRFPRALGVALLVVASCDRGDGKKVGDINGTLGVKPEALVFPRTFVGYPTEVEVELANNSRAPLPLLFATGTPFSVELDGASLAAGEHRKLKLQFAPAAPGDAAGTLDVQLPGGKVSVPIKANAQKPLNCVPDQECRIASFNAEAGVCVEHASPDYTPCTNACVPSGVCVGGTCMGPQIDCDDHNPCTDDSCDRARGCVKTSHACPPPSAPCKVPYCDPKTGCGETNAAEGVGCGPFDCVTMHVCRAGVCMSEVTPEGTTCAAQTPCQARGACHAQKCDQPAPHGLTESWSYAPPAGAKIDFPGVADEHGNVYFTECDAAYRCAVVSLNMAGTVRFRKFITAAQRAPDFSRGYLVLAGDLVVTGLSEDHVIALRQDDGTMAWTKDLRTLLCPNGQGAGSLSTARLASQGDGHLAAVAFGAPCASGDARAYVASLQLADGSLRWSVSYDKPLLGLVVDWNGNLYFRTEVGGTPQLISVTPAGAERYRVAKKVMLTPEAAYWGGIFEDGREVTRADDGQFAYALTFALMGSENPPLVGDGAGFAIGHPCDASGCQMDRAGVFRFDVATGREVWNVDLGAAPGWSPKPILTARESVLFVQGTTLREFGPTGQPVYSCALPGGSYLEPAALSQSYWTVLTTDPSGAQRIKSFLVGINPRDKGWATAGGSMSRNGAPR